MLAFSAYPKEIAKKKILPYNSAHSKRNCYTADALANKQEVIIALSEKDVDRK